MADETNTPEEFIAKLFGTPGQQAEQAEQVAESDTAEPTEPNPNAGELLALGFVPPPGEVPVEEEPEAAEDFTDDRLKDILAKSNENKRRERGDYTQAELGQAYIEDAPTHVAAVVRAHEVRKGREATHILGSGQGHAWLP